MGRRWEHSLGILANHSPSYPNSPVRSAILSALKCDSALNCCCWLVGFGLRERLSRHSPRLPDWRFWIGAGLASASQLGRSVGRTVGWINRKRPVAIARWIDGSVGRLVVKSVGQAAGRPVRPPVHFPLKSLLADRVGSCSFSLFANEAGHRARRAARPWDLSV